MTFHIDSIMDCIPGRIVERTVFNASLAFCLLANGQPPPESKFGVLFPEEISKFFPIYLRKFLISIYFPPEISEICGVPGSIFSISKFFVCLNTNVAISK